MVGARELVLLVVGAVGEEFTEQAQIAAIKARVRRNANSRTGDGQDAGTLVALGRGNARSNISPSEN
jgi:hypothetical protein